MHQVVFHLTGFGVLDANSSSGTSRLMKTLPIYLNKQYLESELPFKVATYTVLDASVNLANDQVKVIHQTDSTANNASSTVYVHCGVDLESSSFLLEEYALNETSYAGIEGNTFNASSKIIKKRSPTARSYRASSLPVPWMCERLSSAGWDEAVKLSDRCPCRSIYNSVYYSSLGFCLNSADKHSLFISCPPLTSINEQEQLSFIGDCLLVIVETLIQNEPTTVPDVDIGSLDMAELNNTVRTLITLGWDAEIVKEVIQATGSSSLDIVYGVLINMSKKLGDIGPQNVQTQLNQSHLSIITSGVGDLQSSNHMKESPKLEGPDPLIFDSQNVEWANILSSQPGRTTHPGYATYEQSQSTQSDRYARHSLPTTLTTSVRHNMRGNIGVPLSPKWRPQEKTLPIRPHNTLSGVQFGQVCKMLLLVREDLMLSVGEIAMQCVQVSSRARRAVDQVDPESVHNWGVDGDQAIIARVSDENELASVVRYANELNLHVLSLLSVDTNDMPAGLTAIGPAPSGVLLEISVGLARFP